jgi:hypothetical protein
VILTPEYYNKLEPPIDEENDMLDLAFGLTETCEFNSRRVSVSFSVVSGAVLRPPPASGRDLAARSYFGPSWKE